MGKKLKQDEWIKRAQKIHNNKYTYEKTHYVNKRTKVIITCPIHGDYEQIAHNHLRGQGCPQCGKEYAKKWRKFNYKNFVNESEKRFNNEYDFPHIDSEYENSHSLITIRHLKCGTLFNKIACDHITSPFGGCPKCYANKSKPEDELKTFVQNLVNGAVLSNDRHELKGSEIDIYLPDYRIGIELNGLFWHNELHKDDNYHVNKLNNALDNGISLYQFYEDEWLYKKNIVKSIISNALNKNVNKYYARKCVIKKVDYKDAVNFFNTNHLQGYCNSKYRYGLYYNNELVSMMMFSKTRINTNNQRHEYEMTRFCNKLNATVIGGASKLFKYFIEHIHPQSIVSYADRRYSKGKLYNMLGFSCYNISKPSYFYVINKQRVNRFVLRKDILVKKYNCPLNMTEHEFCYKNKWYRIYDCGCLCYEWFNN